MPVEARVLQTPLGPPCFSSLWAEKSISLNASAVRRPVCLSCARVVCWRAGLVLGRAPSSCVFVVACVGCWCAASRVVGVACRFPRAFLLVLAGTLSLCRGAPNYLSDTAAELMVGAGTGILKGM